MAPAAGGSATRVVLVFLSAAAAHAALPRHGRQHGSATPRSGAGSPSRRVCDSQRYSGRIRANLYQTFDISSMSLLPSPYRFSSAAQGSAAGQFPLPIGGQPAEAWGGIACRQRKRLDDAERGSQDASRWSGAVGIGGQWPELEEGLAIWSNSAGMSISFPHFTPRIHLSFFLISFPVFHSAIRSTHNPNH